MEDEPSGIDALGVDMSRPQEVEVMRRTPRAGARIGEGGGSGNAGGGEKSCRPRESH